MKKKVAYTTLIITILVSASFMNSATVASAETLMGWQVLETGGSCSESDGVLRFGPTNLATGAFLFKEISPKSDFEFSLQLKASTLGEVHMDQAGELFAMLLSYRIPVPPTFVPPYGAAFELRAQGGGQFCLYKTTVNGTLNWIPFIYNSLEFNDGYSFWHPNPPQDRSNAIIQPNVWYTMKMKVKESPFTVTAEVLNENGTSLGSYSVSDMTDFSFEDIKCICISSAWGGEFFVKNITINIEEYPPDENDVTNTFLDWKVAEGQYLGQFSYGGAYAESNGIITLTKDDRAAGPTLFKDFSPTQDFEISLQVKAETLSRNGGPLSGGSGEGFRLLLQDKGERPTKGVNLEIRGRNGGEFWMAWHSARCDLYGWDCDINAFINNTQGSEIVKAGVWYTMKLTVHQNPYTMTGKVCAEDGTLLGSLTIDDITNFGFTDIKVIEISSLCGGTFYVRNFKINNISTGTTPEEATFMDWRIRPQDGNYSVSNDTIKLSTNGDPDNAPVLYKPVSLKGDFFLSLQVKAPVMNLENYNRFSQMPTTGDFRVGFKSDDYNFSESNDYELEGYGLGGSNYKGTRNMSGTRDPNTLGASQHWQCYDFEYGFLENVWYTIIIGIQRNPYALATIVLDEQGRFLSASGTFGGKDDPRFDNFTFVYITPCVKGDFYVRNISEIPPTGNFTFSPAEPSPNSLVIFNATEKAESYRHPYNYIWNFGDGNTTITQERTITHSFTSTGTFNVTLIAAYYSGGFSSTTKTITITPSTFLSIFTSSSLNATGSAVNVYGRLYEAEGKPLTNQTVVLSYSFEGLNSTLPISSAVTDENGNYVIQWINSASGTLTLHVAWLGDIAHPSVGNSTTLTFLPFASQHAFVVESNSTITSMAFNSTTSELNFNATGPSGTTGYVKATIAKTLLTDAANLRVNLDGKQLNYTLAETEHAWIVTFNYTHSTHQISLFMPHTVAFLPQSNPETADINYWLLGGIVISIIIVSCMLGLAFRGKRKRQLSDYYL